MGSGFGFSSLELNLVQVRSPCSLGNLLKIPKIRCFLLGHYVACSLVGVLLNCAGQVNVTGTLGLM